MRAETKMIFKIVLGFHIFSGVLGLTLGPVAMFSRKSKGVHSYAGEVYYWVMLSVCVSAAAMAVLHWEKSWYFLLISVFSYVFAYRGYTAAKRRKSGWLAVHISGMLGSYIALVTALLVVNAAKVSEVSHLPVWMVWILPTLVGSPIIAMIQLRYRPKKKNAVSSVEQKLGKISLKEYQDLGQCSELIGIAIKPLPGRRFD
jgi:uncharacterized membrane protein